MRIRISTLLAIQATQLGSWISLAAAEPQGDGPACHPRPTCAQQAASSKWVVEGFDYHAEYIFTTPAHQNSHGYVNFQLWNTAVAYTATCSATSDQLTDFFYGTQWYPCTLPSTALAGSDVSFRFNRPTGELDVKGTIMCAENGQGAAAVFPAEGTTQLTLTCTDTTWTNPNWTYGTGEFYSDREVKCVPDTCVF
ncbi:hypothetical protein CONLIGDRAFT_651027 [Coniochaeta ligniaria NRRL 30616]|uniref:AA1-like domain-containing protein n=1 Tax=Coniochaeta ligniaria NRRL 30616 TaxID=1408157 RepID=A0A1J7J5N1_9PEZI|nr:hypothetical protein CONLIGDRAFT_651027 [Coniochaeta ligniaria NRRL 30616]